jgi:hypothetical protein
MYEGELARIEKHLRDGDYTGDTHSLRAIHLLLEEVKRLRSECAHFQQHEAHY